MKLTEYNSVIFRQHVGRFIVHFNKYEIIDSTTREIIGIVKTNMMFIPFIRGSTKFYDTHSEDPIFYLKEKSHFLSREYVLNDQFSRTIGKLSVGFFKIKNNLKVLDQTTGFEYEINLKDPEGKVINKNEQHVASIIQTQDRITKGPRDVEKYKVEIHEEEVSSSNLPVLLLAGTVLIDQIFVHEKVF